MFNLFSVEGNICKNPEEKIFNDKKYISFSIANDGNSAETCFFDVLAHEPSEKMAEYMKKGQRIIASGRLVYSTKNNKRYYMLWADRLNLIFTQREKKDSGE